MILRELLAVFGLDYNAAGQKKAEDGINNLKARTESLSGSFQKIGQILAASGIALFFKKTLAEASADQEGAARAAKLFGENAKAVETWANSTGEALGYQAGELTSLAAGAGLITKNFAKTGEESAQMAMSLSEAAIDMAAFSGEDSGAMLQALRMGLMGMDRPLKRFGIQLGDDELQAFTLKEGIKQSVKAMTEKTKSTLRYKLLLSSLNMVQGSAKASLERYAGATRALSARWGEFMGALGQGLLGPGTQLLTWARKGLDWFMGFAENTNLLKSVMYGLGLILASIVIPQLIALLVPLLPLIGTFILFALAIDEVITTFEGGDSALSRFTNWLDRMEKEGFPGVGGAVETAITIFNRFRDVLGAIGVFFASLFESMLSGNWSTFKNTVDFLSDSFKEWLKSTWLIKEALPALIEAITAPFVKLGGIIGKIVDALKTFGFKAGIKVSEVAGEVIEQGKRLVSPAYSSYMDRRGTREGMGATLDESGLQTKVVSVRSGDQNVNISVQQQPGENQEDFAARVAEIIDQNNAKRDEAIYMDLVQAPEPVL